MINKANSIFEYTGCLPEEMLIKYLSDKLSPAEKHEAEKHLVDCELCSDALEGLGMIRGVQKIQNITSDINRKIQDRVNEKKPGIFFLRQYRVQLAMAAAVLLIAGMILVFRNIIYKSEETGTSGKQLITEKIVPHPQKDRENESKGERVKTAGEKSEAKPLESTGGYKGKSEKQVKDLKTVKEISSDEMPALAENLFQKEEKTEQEKEPPAEDLQYGNINPEETEEVEMKENVIAYEESKTLKSKSRSRQPAAGADVAGATSAIKKAEPASDAAFFSAVSYFNLDKTDSAITYFNKVLQNKSGQYYDDAQWYLFMAYIKKNDIKNARRYLLELKNNSQSQYQKKAEEALNELAE